MHKILKGNRRHNGTSAEEKDVLEKLSSLASAAAIVDDHGSSSEPLMGKKSREKTKVDHAFREEAQVNIHDQDSQTKEEEEDSSSSSSLRNIESSRTNLVFKKRLNWDDVYYGRMTIPLDDVKDIFPKLTKTRGRYDSFCIDLLDEDEEEWSIGTFFDELGYRYMLIIGWNDFVRQHELRPNDTIIFTNSPPREMYKIKFERCAGND